MRRYWIPRDLLNNGIVTFTGDIFHHIFDVCRQQKGSHFEVLLGDQEAHLVEVTEVHKKSALGKVIETRQIPALAKPHLHLALAIPRFPVFDSVIERAVEMGVKSIHPFFSEFSFVRSPPSLPDAKVQRWEKIIISSTQQSGRGDLMTISKAMPLENVFSDFTKTTNLDGNRWGLFAYEGDAQKNIRDYIRSEAPPNPAEIWIFIGGEGGFSQTEVQLFSNAGLKSVTLGDQILRVETACIALISILKYEFELMR